MDSASRGTGIGIGVSKSNPNVARYLEYLESCMALQSVCPEVIDCSRGDLLGSQLDHIECGQIAGFALQLDETSLWQTES